MYYLYILHSENSDKYYVGETPDLETRLLFHNELSQKSYTSRYRPWTLQLSIEVQDRGTARKMERYIKNQKSKAYIISLIESEEARKRLIGRFSSAG